MVVDKFVFNNKGLENDLLNQLHRLGENQKLRYLTSRQLGRVIRRDDVVAKAKRLVKHDIINKNGFYRSETKQKIKELIVRQLQNPNVRKIMKDNLLNYFKTSACQNLFNHGIDDSIAKKWVIALFIDKTMEKGYKML